MLIIHIFFVLLGVSFGRTQQQQINNFDEIKFNQQNRATIVSVPNNNPLPILAVASSASSSSNSQPVSSFAAASFSSVNNIPAVQQSPSNKLGPSNNGQNQTFSIPKAMLSFALEMTRCKSESDSDCSSNMVFSPLSIISTLTMVLMGEFTFRNICFSPVINDDVIKVRVANVTHNYDPPWDTTMTQVIRILTELIGF